MHFLPQALLASLLATSTAFGGTWAPAPQEQAPVLDDLERAVELEHQTRSWALALSTGKFPADLESALDSPSWIQRRAAMDALRRAAPLATSVEVQNALIQHVASGLWDDHSNVIVMALGALDAVASGRPLAAKPNPVQAAAMGNIPWEQLAGADLPSVRLGVVAALAHHYDLGEQGSADFHRVRLELLWGEGDGGLLFDTDPEVRGAARQVLFVAELSPNEQDARAMDRARILLLDRLVTQGSTTEFFAVLQLLARTTPDGAFVQAVSDWATHVAEQRPEALSQLGIDPLHFRGVMEAARLSAGADGDCVLFARAFADWVMARPDSDLEFDSWRTVDDLFSDGARSGSQEMLHALLATALLPRAGVVSIDLGETPAEQFGAMDDPYEEARLELMQALADSGEPQAVLDIASKNCTSDALAIFLMDQFVGGFDAAHLGEAKRWAAAARGSENQELAKNLRLAIVQAISLHHSLHPSRESEAFLLDVMTWNEYACLEEAFKAISDARWSGAERYGLHSNEEVIEGLAFGFDTIWMMSRGVRLDLLIKLPRVPELVAFAPIVIDVGDIAGPLADYRSQCVELLGECVGSPLAAKALERWLAEELEQVADVPGDGPLTRAEELELSGFARAFAGVGAKASWSEDQQNATTPRGQELGRKSIERLLQLSAGRSDELGKHSVAALAQFQGGLEQLAERFLHETGPENRRARMEAGILCLRGGVSVEAALGELTRDYSALGWDLRDRVLRSIANAEGEVSLAFVVRMIRAGLREHDGVVTSEEMTSAIDVLAWRGIVSAQELTAADGLTSELRTILGTLTEASLDASNIESRGIALDRLGSLLAKLNRPAHLEDKAVGDGFAGLESVGKTGEALGFLPGDEATYLQDKATLALVEAYPADDQPDWLRQRVLDGPLALAKLDMIERWRGGSPGAREFSNRSSIEVWRGLTDRRSVLAEPNWTDVDGRLLGSMAKDTLGEDPELAAALFRAAVVALEGEPALDEDVWTEVMGRWLGFAWGRGEWELAGQLAERLIWARRRGSLGTAGFRQVFGVRSASGGTWPAARMESLRLQAAARVAWERGDVATAEGLVRQSAKLVGGSRAAAADQDALEVLMGPRD
ncbi:MAG: hypothetical protein ACI8Q9_002348 [Planctomycetota bacterium]|jgi:hypothetical protein